MGLLLGVLVVAGGVVISAVVVLTLAIGNGTVTGDGSGQAAAARDEDSLAISIIVHVLRSGGVGLEQATTLARTLGARGIVTTAIDITTWSEAFASRADRGRREWLLETCVRAATVGARTIELPQYATLLDVAFGLGFQTDALARLRARMGFDYVDAARAGRPRSADRVGGGAPLFQRGGGDSPDLRKLLELPGHGRLTRTSVVAAYRKLAALHHPDRFHDSPPEERDHASERFLAITRAFEMLLLQCDAD